MIALEPTYAALWDLVSGLPGFNHVTRRPVPPQSLGSAQFPALLMDQGDIDVVNDGSGSGATLTMPVNLLIYTSNGDPNAVPVTAINELLDRVRAAIWPRIPGFQQTLGGLAQSVYTVGKIEVFEGNQGQHSIAILPITILCAE